MKNVDMLKRKKNISIGIVFSALPSLRALLDCWTGNFSYIMSAAQQIAEGHWENIS